MTIHDASTQILNPVPPRKKWHQRWSVRIPAGLALLALAGSIGAAAAGGSHPVRTAAVTPALPASSAPTAPDREATVAGCKALLHWENTYDGPDTADTSPIVDGTPSTRTLPPSRCSGAGSTSRA